MSFIEVSRAILRGRSLPTTGIARRINLDVTSSSLLQEAMITLDFQDNSIASLSLCCTHRAAEDSSIKCSLWSQKLSDSYVISHFENDYLVSEPEDCLKEYTRVFIEAFIQEENVHIVSNDIMSEISIQLTYNNPAVFQGKMKLFLVQPSVDVSFFNVMRLLYSISQPLLPDVTNDATEDSIQPATKKMKVNNKHMKKSNIRGVLIGGASR